MFIYFYIQFYWNEPFRENFCISDKIVKKCSIFDKIVNNTCKNILYLQDKVGLFSQIKSVKKCMYTYTLFQLLEETTNRLSMKKTINHISQKRSNGEGCNL